MMGIKEMHQYIKKERNFFQNTVKNIQILRNTRLMSVFIPISKKGNAKESSNYCTMVLISHAREVMQKFSELGFNRMRTENFQMFKLDLEKGEESDVELPASAGSSKKKENSRKTSTSLLLTILLKPLTVWITKKL